jgi:hypothetical protein
MERWMDGWKNGWMDGWMDGLMDGRMDGNNTIENHYFVSRNKITNSNYVYLLSVSTALLCWGSRSKIGLL